MPGRTAEAASLGEVLRHTRARFAAAGIAEPALEARLIVEHFSQTARVDAIARPEMALAPSALAAVEAALRRRLAGEPVHRILGFREFYGLALSLSPATLEPRPDTETLVEAMLPFVRQRVALTGACAILDLGTGTGALALALLSAVPAATALASDIAPEALETAASNAVRLGLANRFRTVESNWWQKIEGEFDAIVSNPPYIETRAIAALEPGVRDFDPFSALDGGEDGLAAYRSIVAHARKHLAPAGRIGVEIGMGQGPEVERLFAGEGFVSVSTHSDLGGHDRAMIFMR